MAVVAGVPPIICADCGLHPQLLAEQRRALAEKIIELSAAFPDATSPKLISASEARLVLTARHLQTIAVHYSDSMGPCCVGVFQCCAVSE
jgi:hypothetical protein